VGNLPIRLGLPEKTPCKTCKYFGGWGEHCGRFVRCLYWKQPMWGYKDGCRWWEREPGSDDEGDTAEAK
jgi:hypothetical protein